MWGEIPKGSIILCQECGHPVYALERGLGPWDKAGRGVSAFRPLRMADLEALLVERPDLPLVWQLGLAKWVAEGKHQRVLDASRPKAGEEAICPWCGGCWVQFQPRESHHSEMDRGYTILLRDVPPLPMSARVARRIRWRSDEQDDSLVVEERTS